MNTRVLEPTVGGERNGRFIAALLLGLMTAMACSDRTDPGDGTETLYAQIEIVGRPDNTAIETVLKAGGNPVVGANVVFRDADTNKEVTAESPAAGIYRAIMHGYTRTVAVQITAGRDQLEAQLEGPSPHVITRPPNNAIVKRDDFEVLRVEWESEEKAEAIEITSGNSNTLQLDHDEGNAKVPLGGLENGEQRLTVIRETSVDLSGGLTGSRMRCRYTVDNRFTLDP